MQTGLCLSPQQAAEIFAAVPGVAKEGVQLGGRGAAEITIVTGQKSIASNFIGRLCVTFKTRFGREFVVKFQIGLCLCQTTCSSLVQTGLLRRGIKDKMCWLLDSIAGLSQ